MITQTPQMERTGPRLGPDPAAGEVVLAYLGEHAARLEALAPAVQRDDAESVHKLRVEARRLRSTLQSFPTVLPEEATERLRDELKWLGGVLGEAREYQVLSERLAEELGRYPPELLLGPVQARLRAHFAPREAAAAREVADALGSPRFSVLLKELSRFLADPPCTAPAAGPADKVLPAAIARAFRRTRRRMRDAKRTPPGPARDVALHEARKAAKRARYAAEAVEPVYGKRARRFAKRMKALQSALGEHQDAVDARPAIREIGVQAHLAGENAFSFGLLHELEHHQALECQDQARRAWKRAARRKVRNLG